MRRGRFAVTHYDRAAIRRRVKEQLREIIRQTYAAVAGRIAGQRTGVHGDAAPGESLHVRHGRIVILLGVMRLFLFENAEYTTGRGMTLRAGAHSGAADQDAIAIDVHGLLRNAYEHDYGAI